jgi:hypothetical protein
MRRLTRLAVGLVVLLGVPVLSVTPAAARPATHAMTAARRGRRRHGCRPCTHDRSAKPAPVIARAPKSHAGSPPVAVRRLPDPS